MNTLVSIVICTFNRAEILDRCLNSLKDYEAPSYSLELLIVDNNSSDNTQEIVTRFKEGIQNRFPVEYLVEPTVGLSHARNKGVSEAQSPWIFFLDDDAMITAHFYTELERCIKAEYDAFTGVFDPYYIGDKPSWLHTSYGSKGSFKSDLSDLEDDYLCGGVMGFKTEVLKKVGGFPSGLGMAGAKVFYGEETFVERQLRKQNYKLGVNPKLRILHLVSQKKYSFRWNLKSAKAIGKSQRQIAQSGSSIPNDNLSYFLKHTFLEIPKVLFYRIWKQGYSLKYALLKILEPYYILAGRIF